MEGNLKPYVYQGIHPVTEEFYFGYRSRNTRPASDDLGIHYFTSSKYVKPRFAEFDWIVLREFETKSNAHEFEQGLIRQHWGNPLMMNRSMFPKIIHHGSEKQKNFARKRMLTDNPMKLLHNREAARQRATGKIHSKETKLKMSTARLGKKNPQRKAPNQSGDKNPSAKCFIFRNPLGEEFVVNGGLRHFCVQHELGYNSMIDLGKSRRQSYRGWSLVSKT